MTLIHGDPHDNPRPPDPRLSRLLDGLILGLLLFPLPALLPLAASLALLLFGFMFGLSGNFPLAAWLARRIREAAEHRRRVEEIAYRKYMSGGK